jgi:hypothetical protein
MSAILHIINVLYIYIVALFRKNNMIYIMSNIEDRNIYFSLCYIAALLSKSITYLLSKHGNKKMRVLYLCNGKHFIGVQYWFSWCQKKGLLSNKA